jgi:hypothetical protein
MSRSPLSLMNGLTVEASIHRFKLKLENVKLADLEISTELSTNGIFGFFA